MSDYTDLIADARVWPRDGVSKGPLINALADAIEALVKERDQAIRDLDAGFAESDHLSAKYYQRMRAAEKHARMRASESADLERERDELAAEVERLKLVHVGQARLAMSAVYLADVDGDEGTQAFYQEWVRAHDAALIESLADEWAADPDAWGDNDKDYRNGLRDRAQQIREGGNW